jgi:hypothetical protein
LLLMLRILVYAASVPVLTRARLTSWSRFAGGRRAARGVITPGLEQKTIDHVEAVLVAFRPVVRTGCLVRGLTLYHFLRRAGVDVSLSFGVGRVGDGFTGHCWLVKDGHPFLEQGRPDLNYVETLRLPVVEGAGA